MSKIIITLFLNANTCYIQLFSLTNLLKEEVDDVRRLFQKFVDTSRDFKTNINKSIMLFMIKQPTSSTKVVGFRSRLFGFYSKRVNLKPQMICEIPELLILNIYNMLERSSFLFDEDIIEITLEKDVVFIPRNIVEDKTIYINDSSQVMKLLIDSSTSGHVTNSALNFFNVDKFESRRVHFQTLLDEPLNSNYHTNQILVEEIKKTNNGVRIKKRLKTVKKLSEYIPTLTKVTKEMIKRRIINDKNDNCYQISNDCIKMNHPLSRNVLLSKYNPIIEDHLIINKMKAARIKSMIHRSKAQNIHRDEITSNIGLMCKYMVKKPTLYRGSFSDEYTLWFNPVDLIDNSLSTILNIVDKIANDIYKTIE